MDTSPQLQRQQRRLSLDCASLPEWAGGGVSESQSNASSPGSHSWTPGEELTPPSRRVSHYPQQQTGDWYLEQAGAPHYGSRRERCRVAGSQRHSASEREKMRMRILSKAVQNLRKYLPPSVAPSGQNLTKIETLRLAIQYIAHLTELLGLSEAALAQRRQEELQMYDLHLKSQDCFHEERRGLHLGSPAPREHSTFYVSTPEFCMPGTTSDQPEGQGQDSEEWFSSPQCYEDGTRHPGQPRGQYVYAEPWMPSPPCAATGTAPTEQDAGYTHSDSWLSSSFCSKLAQFYHCQMSGSPASDIAPTSQSSPKHSDPAQIARDPRRSTANSMLRGLSIPCLQ